MAQNNATTNEEAMPGALIAIEGGDGSGKHTQAMRLVEHLEQEAYDVAMFSFPRYETPSGVVVKTFLDGAMGDPATVDPYRAAMLYAADRVFAVDAINDHLHQGHVVVLDRYVGSNAAYQGAKIPDRRECDYFLQWLYRLEYEDLRFPQPDMTMVLVMDVEASQRLLRDEGEELDGNERNVSYLERVVRTYFDIASRNRDDHYLIGCMNDDGSLKSPEAIHTMIWRSVQQELQTRRHQ